MVSGRSFARQASDNLIEVFSNFSESPRDERYDLLSKEIALGGLEWAAHRYSAIPDHISRKFPVKLFELRLIFLRDLLCSPVSRGDVLVVVVVAADAWHI